MGDLCQPWCGKKGGCFGFEQALCKWPVRCCVCTWGEARSSLSVLQQILPSPGPSSNSDPSPAAQLSLQLLGDAGCHAVVQGVWDNVHSVAPTSRGWLIPLAQGCSGKVCRALPDEGLTELSSEQCWWVAEGFACVPSSDESRRAPWRPDASLDQFCRVSPSTQATLGANAPALRPGLLVAVGLQTQLVPAQRQAGAGLSEQIKSLKHQG